MYYRNLRAQLGTSPTLFGKSVSGAQRLHLFVFDKEIDLNVDWSFGTSTWTSNENNLKKFLIALGVTDDDLILSYAPAGINISEITSKTKFSLESQLSAASNTCRAYKSTEPKSCLIVAHRSVLANNVKLAGINDRTALADALSQMSFINASCGFRDSDAEVVLLADKIEEGQDYRFSDLVVTIPYDA